LDDDATSHFELSWGVAAAVAAGAIGLSFGRFIGLTALVFAGAGVGVLLLALWLARRSDRIIGPGVEVAAVAVIVAFSVTAIPKIDTLYGGVWPGWQRVLIAAVALFGVMPASMRIVRRQVLVGVFLIWIVAVLSVVSLTQYPDSGVDVQRAHTEASELLLEGRNPYSDMVIPDGSPTEVNQGTIVGYSYPPVSLVMYSAGFVLGDARYTGIVAIVVTLAVVLGLAIRSYSGASIFVGTIATIPLLSGMIIGGWTEPIQAMFLVLSAATYRRWVLSSVLVGLAVASKQYMVLVLVPMLVSADSMRYRRVAVAVAVAAATYLPFLVWNPTALWYALVGYQLERIPRADAVSVWSIGWEVPAVVAAVVAVALCLLAWRGLRTRATITLAQAAILGVYFVLAPNSFGNFWFLVTVIVVSSVTLVGPTRSEVGDGPSLSVATS